MHSLWNSLRLLCSCWVRPACEIEESSSCLSRRWPERIFSHGPPASDLPPTVLAERVVRTEVDVSSIASSDTGGQRQVEKKMEGNSPIDEEKEEKADNVGQESKEDSDQEDTESTLDRMCEERMKVEEDKEIEEIEAGAWATLSDISGRVVLEGSGSSPPCGGQLLLPVARIQHAQLGPECFDISSAWVIAARAPRRYITDGFPDIFDISTALSTPKQDNLLDQRRSSGSDDFLTLTPRSESCEPLAAKTAVTCVDATPPNEAWNSTRTLHGGG
eukprot:TRINITY_DN67637_c0_g1_i1.p1 TRINITY_DN67637_c0_g1~~TRINITY_DN67637_c0_g1_i1.p1  ORF type:complete len:274 (+),score=52.35 TRINITY_DN67637_c0_g1_i1:70-891(+)